MILHLTKSGKKWDWCDADLSQHSPDKNELTHLQPLEKSGNLSEEHASFFPKLLKIQRSTLLFHFPPYCIKQDRPYFFPATSVYCITDPGENFQKTLLIV